MHTRDVINKTREYLDYIEEHFNNVILAFDEFAEKSGYHEDFLLILKGQILSHDYSKLSEKEFVQYRKTFFPTDDEEGFANRTYGISAKLLNASSFCDAWENHKENNPHHWENWSKKEYCWNVDVCHMIIDWMAMSYKFDGNVLDYYLRIKDNMDITKEQRKFLEITLNNIYKKGVNKCVFLV